jgi:hypothetical protein
MRGLVGIVGKHALVEILVRCQRGLVAQHDVEEFQSIDMSTKEQ